MTRRTDTTLDGVAVIRLENEYLRVDVAPSVGGRIVGLQHKQTGYEFLWRNASLPLRRAAPGAAYDPEFYGGIDEHIPCDLPEVVDGVAYPDHGELWTQELEAAWAGHALILTAPLPRLGFRYQRRLELAPDAPELRALYQLENRSDRPRAFLWKLHAALAVAPGDRIWCPATRARPLDLAWSRCQETTPFAWPRYADLDMSVVPAPDGTAEFLALTDLDAGEIGWLRPSTGLRFRITFDRAVFTCCWLFASYGKLLGHYTVVLEPATSPWLTLAEANASGLDLRLPAGAVLETQVVISMG